VNSREWSAAELPEIKIERPMPHSGITIARNSSKGWLPVPLFPHATYSDSDDFSDTPPDTFDDRNASGDWTYVAIDTLKATF
jgi:hypothetical protein